MPAQDKNRIFFGLVHYILSEQSNVDWIFKTSVINYTEAKQTVGGQEASVAKLQDIINFIYDIKPYHVQFSEFLQQMEIDSEAISVSVGEETDYTQTIRFDNVWSAPDNELQDIIFNGQTPKREWLTTTMANRLYCMGLRDLDELKIELRADFKGKILNGGSSVEDKMGYDILLYDEDMYDSPSIIYDYCIRDYAEDFSDEALSDGFKYTKEFPEVGSTNFVFESDVGVDKTNLRCTIYRALTGRTTILSDYSIVKSGNYQFSMFQPLNEDDKLIIRIVNPDNKLREAFVYVESTFSPQDGSLIKRKIIPLTDEIVVEEPESNIATKRLLVVKEFSSGTRVPFTNYTKRDGKVIAHNFADKEHIILSAFDYQFLYDLTLSYSDPTVKSNNTIIYSGGNFLRPDYNEDRPEDLCVGHFSEHLSVYMDDNSKYELDFKDENSHFVVAKAVPQKITSVTIGSAGYVVAFAVENAKIFPKEPPFLLQVGEEQIKVNTVSGNAVGNLIRGYNGTPLYTDSAGKDIAAGDIAFFIPEVGKTTYEPLNKTISYYVGKYQTKDYFCPIGSDENSSVEVYRLEVGSGVPVKMSENQYSLKSEQKFVFGVATRNPLNPAETFIYDKQGKLLYWLKGSTVYNKQNEKVGLFRRNILTDMHGKRLGKIDTDGNFVAEMIRVIPLIALNDGDVLHISVTEQ